MSVASPSNSHLGPRTLNRLLVAAVAQVTVLLVCQMRPVQLALPSVVKIGPSPPSLWACWLSCSLTRFPLGTRRPLREWRRNGGDGLSGCDREDQLGREHPAQYPHRGGDRKTRTL